MSINKLSDEAYIKQIITDAYEHLDYPDALVEQLVSHLKPKEYKRGIKATFQPLPNKMGSRLLIEFEEPVEELVVNGVVYYPKETKQ